MKYFLKNYTLIRLYKLTLEQVLPYLNTEFIEFKKGIKPERKIIDGYRVKTGTLRLVTFKTCGLKCAHCSIEGSFFAVESHKKAKTSHLNLYAINENGEEVLMTHDHIMPKSKGGLNKLHNCQTMCKPCNERKGSDV